MLLSTVGLLPWICLFYTRAGLKKLPHQRWREKKKEREKRTKEGRRGRV